MNVQLAIVLVYLLAMFAVGLLFHRQSRASSLEYLLAGRRLGRLLLFFTMAATNFSAFTIFGLSGAGYRIGYAFFPVMGFGTGFMALAFWLIGSRISALAGPRGYLSPADFVLDRYGSPALKICFSLLMIVLTLPYVAIQAISAGRSLQAMAGLPYWAGAALVMGFTMLYVALGGMRSVAWTDLVQALMIVLLTMAGFALIAVKSGGFIRAATELQARDPQLFSRPGLDGSMTPGIWLGYMLLWLFADPMFPQLFHRFLAARSPRTLKTTVVLYPLITTFLFFLTVSIGVMGRFTFPGLSAGQSESIYPLLLARFASPVLSTLLLTGGLAALMSTLDSQLLTLSSMVSLDFGARALRSVPAQKLLVVLIGALGFLLALRPPQTILDFINRTSFTGLAVLAPVVVGGLYWKKANSLGALAGILSGEALVVLSFLGIVKTPGVLPVVPALALTIVVFASVSLLTPSAAAVAARPVPASPPARPPADAPAGIALVAPVRRPSGRGWLPWLVFAAIFFLGNDFWAWGRRPILLAGLPLWVWYYILLGLALSAAYRLLLRPEGKDSMRKGGDF